MKIEKVKTNGWLFISLWVAAMLIYSPSFYSGYVAEFINYLQSYLHGTFKSFLNREDTYVKSLYQITQLLRYLFFKLFFVNPWFWFLFVTGLHALNTTLIFRFFSNLFQDFELKSASITAFVGAIFFFISPNITEITVWKATDHYLIGVLMQLCIILWVQRLLQTEKIKYAIYASILFAISIFTLEIFYVTPFITLFLIMGYRWRQLISAKQSERIFWMAYIPQLLLFLIHLLLFRIIYGTWIAHYGTTNEFVWLPQEILAGYGKYFMYIGLDAGFLPEKYRVLIFDFLSKPFIAYGIFTIISMVIFFGVIYFKKLSSRSQIFLFLLAILFGSLTLVVTIPFDPTFPLYNSRRSYQTGIFLYMIIALLLFTVKKRQLALVVSLIYITINIFLLEKMIFRWRAAAKIQFGLLRNFHWQQNDPVLLLNVPTYLNGVRIIPASEDNEFIDQQNFFGYPKNKGKVFTISSYNMNTSYDGAHITILDSNTLKVTLNQWGSWWMFNYHGAKSYENNLFRVEIIDVGHEYILHLKKHPKNMVILFQHGDWWSQVNLHKLGEQW
ncbi:MAG: hypothetical protein JSS78_08540 [Bacteroidetes bacterium]|nr:hypothetical protein [Bacteroidota bacterium]